MPSKGRHPKKEIEAALEYARARGWTVTKAGRSAHASGVMTCPGDCPQVSISSTPKVPAHHAAYLRRKVDACPHNTTTEED